jgi:EAL domain-containing protein (putative c-di-GMP-specific phosphodiesterase class I)
MFFPALEQYLARLGDASEGGAGGLANSRSIWRDDQGRVQGRFFNATLTSAFQTIHALGADGDGHISGYEGFARSYTASDQGLSLWRLLDQAASDDESVALDRLCRMLHAINFFRQQPASDVDSPPDLYLSVHARLLAAVASHHGVAFRRVLDALEVPHERIVLQLPPVRSNQDWPLAVVLQNYRRNGFRLALNADDAQQGCQLLDLPGQAQADVIKVDAREIGDQAAALRLIRGAARRGVRLIFTRVDTVAVQQTLLRLGEQAGQPIWAQGFLWNLPTASLSSTQSSPSKLLGKPVDAKSRCEPALPACAVRLMPY